MSLFQTPDFTIFADLGAQSTFYLLTCLLAGTMAPRLPRHGAALTARPDRRGRRPSRQGRLSTHCPRNGARQARRSSRSAATARPGPPSLGAAGAAAAATVRPLSDASRRDRPVPAASRAGLDPNGLRRRSAPATAQALGGGALPRSALSRPCRRRCSHGVSPPPRPSDPSTTLPGEIGRSPRSRGRNSTQTVPGDARRRRQRPRSAAARCPG